MAQPAAAGQEQFRAGHPQVFQRFPQTGTACGDRTVLPPLVEGSPVSYTVADKNSHRQMLLMKKRVNPLDAASGFIQGQVRNRNVFMHQGVVHGNPLPFSYLVVYTM